MRKSLLATGFLMLAFSLAAADITVADGDVYYSETTEWGKVETNFKKCGNNKLYTFYNVLLDGVEVNHTRSSNNIGGFLADGWWMGGNHNDGKPNAATVSVAIAVDGVEVDGDAIVSGKVLTVDVENDIFFADGVKFCTEHISYSVSGNSIEVRGRHDYCHPRALTIDKYYPMQSVFVDESEILTPGGRCRTWTPLVVTSEGNETEFSRASAPNFCTFVEHGAHGYQAVYLSREGIGDRSWVRPGDVVFIGNSWGKSYHKVIGDYEVKSGDVSGWHGVYSWFREPVTDRCRNASDDLTFEYGAFIGGEPVVMSLGPSGRLSQTSGIDDVVADSGVVDFASVGDGCISISADAPDARCFSTSGMLVHVGSGMFECQAGIYLVSDMRGNTVRLSVK